MVRSTISLTTASIGRLHRMAATATTCTSVVAVVTQPTTTIRRTAFRFVALSRKSRHRKQFFSLFLFVLIQKETKRSRLTAALAKNCSFRRKQWQLARLQQTQTAIVFLHLIPIFLTPAAICRGCFASLRSEDEAGEWGIENEKSD